MLRSVLFATYRGQRRAALVWGLALALFTLVTMWSNWRNEYPTDEARQRLAQQVESGGLAFGQVVFGEAHQVDQFAGHLEWRALGLLPLLLGLYMVLAATGISRGAEERGELDVLLTAPRTRTRLFAEQAGGLALVLTTVCALVWAAALTSGPVAGEPVPAAGRAALSVLNVGLSAALFGAVALLVSQFARSRRAAGTTAGALLVASFLVANVGLLAPVLERWRPLSPLYLYSRSTPLTDGHVSIAAVALMSVITLGCSVIAAVLFSRRDLGARIRVPASVPAIVRQRMRPPRAAAGTWLLGNGLQRGFRNAVGPVAVWAIGLGLYAILVTAATPSIRAGFGALPETRQAVERLEFELTSDSGIISSVLFLTLPLLVALFAVTLASSWANEEQAGRLELDLSSPVPRRRYFLERAGAALASVASVVAVIAIAFLGTASLAGVDLPWARAGGAALLLTLPAGVVVAFGYLITGLQPRITGSVLAIALALSFAFDLLAPALDLPEAVNKVSIFSLYGRPVVEGIRWWDVGAMLGLIAIFSAVGALAFGRRDVLK